MGERRRGCLLREDGGEEEEHWGDRHAKDREKLKVRVDTSYAECGVWRVRGTGQGVSRRN